MGEKKSEEVEIDGWISLGIEVEEDRRKGWERHTKWTNPFGSIPFFLIRITVYPPWGISETTEEYIGKTTTYINSVSATVTRYLWSPKNLIIMSITGKIQGV